MRTIGRHWPVGIGPDRQALCSYCGVQWRRSQLTRDASQNLACPDCAPGLDIVSLSEGNARLMRSQQAKTVGPVDGSFDEFTSPPDPGFVDPNGAPETLANTSPIGPLSVVVNMWLRSDLVTLDSGGTRVTAWSDQSNRGNAAIAPTVASRPTYNAADGSLGNMPTVAGDGASNYLTSRTYFGGAPLWAWVIFKSNIHLGRTLIAAGARFGQGVAPGTMRYNNNAGAGPDNAGAGAVGNWARAIWIFNAAAVDILLVKGTVVSTASAGQINSAFGLFGRGDGTDLINATVAELLLTDGPPTSAERNAIEAYGVARYGGSLFA